MSQTLATRHKHFQRVLDSAGRAVRQDRDMDNDLVRQDTAVQAIMDRRGCDRMTAVNWLRLLKPTFGGGDPRYSLGELNQLVATSRNKGGRPASAIPIEVQAKAAAWLAAEGCPEKQADVENRIHELLAVAGRQAAESTVRDYARALFTEYRRALREGR
jgi:hypothetical protein